MRQKSTVRASSRRAADGVVFGWAIRGPFRWGVGWLPFYRQSTQQTSRENPLCGRAGTGNPAGKECVERLEQDKETLLESYAKMAPEALEALSAEERRRLYRMLRLRVVANPDRSIEVTGALVLGFTPTETVLR